MTPRPSSEELGPTLAAHPFMRALRQLVPGQWHFVTDRCIRSEFRLRPDKHRKELVGFHLAKAAAACEGIKIVAFVQMSNHFHLVVRDTRSELSRFMNLFAGQLAAALNKLDGHHGPFFERRFSSEPILDESAVLDRIRYTVLNPVAACLVESHQEWPGLLMWPGGCRTQTFVRRRLRSGQLQEERVQLRIDEDWSTTERIRSLAELVRLGTCALHRMHRREPLGAHRVVAQNICDTPEHSKRSPAPLCHASSLETLLDYKKMWGELVALYRRASERFRAGDSQAVFPPYFHRPSMGLNPATGQSP